MEYLISSELRFGIGLGLILIASMQKRKSCQLNLVIAILILWAAFGLPNVIYYLNSVIMNLALLWALNLNIYCLTVLNIVNLYVYKAYGNVLDSRIGGTFDISGILMILTVKSGYLIKDFDNNIQNTLNYIFFIPGLITGPIMPYDCFVSRDTAGKVSFPKLEMVKTLIFLLVYALNKVFDFKGYIVAPDRSQLCKILSLYLFNVCCRSKFLFAWSFAHCCFTMQNFPDYLNIDVMKTEFPESLDEITGGWNKFVSLWLKTLFFIPLKERSMLAAVAVTYAVSSALHGINLGYLVFFFSFALYRTPIKRANRAITNKTLRRIQTISFVMYFSMPFYLLNMKLLYETWKSVYFYGHFYGTFWLLYCLGEKVFQKNVLITDTKKTINEPLNVDVTDK